MNRTIEELIERKSVRAFTDQPITAELKRTIIQAAVEAPTAGNQQLYTILDITDQKLKERLSETCDHQPFIATAPLVLVFLADYRRWVRKFAQAGCEAPKPRLSDLILSTNDAVIAAHAACVAAESFGIGSCYIGDIIEQWETHQKAFNLPQYVAPVSMLVFGYPTQLQKDRKQPSRFPKEMIVFENGYHDLTDEELLAYYDNEKAAAFCKRKYTSDFALEMERSAKEILKNWMGEP